MHRARVEGSAVLYNDELVVFNGFGSGLKIENSVEKYSFQNKRWNLFSNNTSIAQANAVTHAGSVLVGNEAWLVGGRVGAHPGYVSKRVWIYNLGNNQWREGPTLPVPFAGGGAAAINNKLYVFGGVDAQASCDVSNHFVLDLNNQQGGWKNITDVAPMPSARNHFATAVYNQKILAIGGQHGHDGCGSGQDVALVHEFNPATMQWQRKADLPMPQSHSEPATFAYEGFIYTIGGEVGNGNAVLRYDPRADSWQQILQLPAKLIAPAARIVNGELVVAGGGAPRAQQPSRTTYAISLKTASPAPSSSSQLNFTAESASSDNSCPDSDGDGWGFINGQSCRVAANSVSESTSENTATMDADACIDTDGDGWGFANGEFCQVGDTNTNILNNPATQATPVQDCPDPDGDGWGFANGESCRVDHSTISDLDNLTTPAPVQDCPDPDGDGWGFANGESCRVGDTNTANLDDLVTQPVHVQDCPDPDGDGWGFANGESCRVGDSSTNDLDNLVTPTTVQDCPDSDGDGWGFANGESCQVGDTSTNDLDNLATQPAPVQDCPDPDGDGWGFFNGASCRVIATDGAASTADPVNNVSPSQSSGRNVNADIAWDILQTSDGSYPKERHEASAVAVGRKIYLLGGRGSRPVNSYDSATRDWQHLGGSPVEFSHFQAVAVGSKIYVIGAFLGQFPNERVDASIRVFDTATQNWSVVGNMPSNRLRGSAGTAVYNGKIYLVGGNTNGHMAGAVKWFDEYDPATGRWTALPDAPDSRDHFSAVVVGDKLVAAGGRRTAFPNTFGNTVGAVNIYNFSTGRWSKGSDIPTRRAGTMALSVGTEAIVIGGESDTTSTAHNNVQAYDVDSNAWRLLQPLIVGRHGGGAALVGDTLHVISGNTSRGGGDETQLQEFLQLR